MRHLLTSVAFLALALPLGPRSWAHAAGQDKQQAVNPAAGPNAGYVGEAVCATCHEAEAKGFADNPHSLLALEHGNTGVTCESCHGPGKAHVEGGGDISKIFDPAKATPQGVDKMCLGCHAGVHPNFERSPHARAGLTCLSCHSVHHAATLKFLLTAAQPQLCFRCHTDVKPQFDMPFHHPVNEGVVNCADCHDPHGTFGEDQLRMTADQNMICTKCHTDVRGPFVYEHPAVKAEGCLGCHSPHGSQNARMLNMPSINMLCNQCHSRLANAAVHGMGAGSDELSPCTSCHTYIHGSNINAAFLR
ncbi:MAG: DmsE family decaheme c-type cytochrome [Acidobacteriaceae bacterium]